VVVVLADQLRLLERLTPAAVEVVPMVRHIPAPTAALALSSLKYLTT
jgi:hypothetical protein